MAGAFGFGNSGPAFLAEFNVYLDVKGCVAVLDWGKHNNVPMTIVPWDMPFVVWRKEAENLHSTDPWGKVCKEAMLKYFPVHGGDGIPGDPIAGVNKQDQCWYTTDPKVSMWLLKPELCLRVPTSMYVVTDRDAPRQFGRTVTERPTEAHSGPYAIHYVVPGQPELVRQELFRQLELKSK